MNHRESDTSIRQFTIHCNGQRFSGIHGGSPDRPPVILLHGFPEFSFSWRYQIPVLVRAGFYVIAPDLRGYNTSSKPSCVIDYRIEALVGDVIALIKQVGGRQAAVVGHDWGGIIAWFAAMWHPQHISRLAILNAPHPAAYFREMRRPTQLLCSWYVFFFQLPWLPEALIRFDDFAVVRRLFRRGPACRSPDPQEDERLYIQALAQPGALTAALNYYRAAFRRSPLVLAEHVRPTATPTLLIWGDRDAYLVPALTEGLEPWVKDLQVEHLPNATHWVQHDMPTRVNELLLDFLAPPCR